MLKTNFINLQSFFAIIFYKVLCTIEHHTEILKIILFLQKKIIESFHTQKIFYNFVLLKILYKIRKSEYFVFN